MYRSETSLVSKICEVWLYTQSEFDLIVTVTGNATFFYADVDSTLLLKGDAVTYKLNLWLVLAVGIITLTLAQPLRAESPAVPNSAPVTITVNTLQDKLDPNDGKCSLREAMARAFNSSVNVNECTASNSGNTLIQFAVAGTIVLTHAVNHGSLPDTINTVTLMGPITIDATNVPSIIFDVESSGRLSLVNVTIKNATYTAIDSRGDLKIAGGKFENNSAGGAGGGAIRNDGTATIAGTSFINNKAVQKDTNEATKAGGAIRTTWVLTVAGSTFTGNVSDAEGGAIAFIAGRMEIADSAFTGNVTKGQLPNLSYDGTGGQTGEGGGAISLRANANTYPSTIKRSTFSGNVALEGIGGALVHNGGMKLTIQDSSFQGNHAGSPGKLGAGGAIHNMSEMLIKRTMFVANSVEGDGGAIANRDNGQLTLRMVGFTGNNASGKGGALTTLNLIGSVAQLNALAVAINGNIAGDKGGGIYNHDAKYDKAEFRLAVFAGNLPQNCRDKQESDQDFPPDDNIPDDDEVWPIDSKGQNSFSDNSCDKPESTDQSNTDPKLDPVPAVNGSTVPGLLTQKPLPGSPLIDKIAPVDYPSNDPDVGNEDIRGLPRLSNGDGIGLPLFDIGPFEVDDAAPDFSSLPVPGSVITVGTSTINVPVTKTNALQIFNSGDLTLTLSSVAFSGANASMFAISPMPANVVPLGSTSHDIRCTPSGAGTYTATLSFNTNDPDESSASYTVKCIGTAAPTAGFSSDPNPPGPKSVETEVGTLKNILITVKETGSANLVLSNAILTSTPPGEIQLLTAFPFTIVNGGAQVNVTARCNATTTGVKSAVLSFNTNDPTKPTVSYNLSCLVKKAVDPLFPIYYWSTAGLTPPSYGPYGIALSPDGKHAYVADEGSHTIVVYNALNNGQQSTSLGYASTFDSATLSATNRFTSPLQVAVSADGKNVYATGWVGDAIAVFSRDGEDGSLTWVDTIDEGDGYGCSFINPCNYFVDGLDGAYGIAISPDGNFVYVSSIFDNAVSVLRRNTTTGALSTKITLGTLTVKNASFVQKYTHANLSAAYGIALSPDGAQLYATSYVGDAVLVLTRDPISGTLTTAQVITSGMVAGLDGVFRVVVSKDGRFVYTAGGNSGTGGVCTFARNAIDGKLTFQSCIADNTAMALNGASDLALSPNGKWLFVTSRLEDGVNAFARDPDDGSLSFVEMITGTGGTLPPLSTARGVVVAPDGKYVYATGHDNDAVVSLPIANPKPVATSLLPAAKVAGSAAFSLTVKGDGFIIGSIVRVNGSNRTTLFVNETELIASVQASDVAAVGNKAITVFNATPGGGTSNPVTLTVVATASDLIPSIESISILGLVAGSAPVSITVKGSDFAATAKVVWNNVLLVTTFISSTQLVAQVPANLLNQPGINAITVVNSGVLPRAESAQASSTPATPFALDVAPPNENPIPSLNTLSPNKAEQLSDITQLDVTLNGYGFVLGAVAQWNGETRPTTLVSATQLKITLSAGDLAVVGPQSITVINPPLGGGVSNVKTFEVLAYNPVAVFKNYLPLVVR
jgi:CSLREA domain-containing protein